MKARIPGAMRFPSLYQEFKNSQEIANVINRSCSYVKKALRVGFTQREKQMLEAYIGKDLYLDD